MFPNTIEKPKTIEFNGTRFQLMGRGKYYLSQSRSNEGRKGAKGLHVAIYEHFNQVEVPKGNIVHHKDGNPFNNAPENLEMMTRQDHFEHHKDDMMKYNQSEKQKKHLAKVRPKASEWHKSEKGREWHREQAKKTILARKPKPFNCVTCDKYFESINSRAKFCSRKCESKWRYDNIRYEKKCENCAKTFMAKQKRIRFCSRSCGSMRGNNG